jgi:RNA polymerase sigma factor (sigma-70 family)
MIADLRPKLLVGAGPGTAGPAAVYLGRREGGGISDHPGDTDVLARVRAGDREAYAELVRRHAPVAVRTAVLLGAGTDAEDVVQDAFVKAYAGLGKFRDGAPFRPWLLRIVANETRNLQRAAGRRAARERAAWERTAPLLTAGHDDPESVTLSRERRAQLVEGLTLLSDTHRQVVVCRYLLDLDEAETAVVLGWPRGTVKSRLRRALDQLARTVGRETDPAAAGPEGGAA